MSEVFLCTRSAGVTAQAKRDLRAAGVVVVECDSLDHCRFISATTPMPADDLLWAAVEALDLTADSSAAIRRRFISNLAELMDKHHTKT